MRLLNRKELEEYKSSVADNLLTREHDLLKREAEAKKVQDNLFESVRKFNEECELKRDELDKERLLVECFKSDLQEKEKELNKMKQEFLNKVNQLKL